MRKVITNKRLYLPQLFRKITIVLLIIYSILITYLYANKRSVSSSFYDDQAVEITNFLKRDDLGIEIDNQIDNFVALSQHSLPFGGGGWGVYKKENGEWKELFLSSDETWCELYGQYKLPKGLIGECTKWSDFVKDNK